MTKINKSNFMIYKKKKICFNKETCLEKTIPRNSTPLLRVQPHISPAFYHRKA